MIWFSANTFARDIDSSDITTAEPDCKGQIMAAKRVKRWGGKKGKNKTDEQVVAANRRVLIGVVWASGEYLYLLSRARRNAGGERRA